MQIVFLHDRDLLRGVAMDLHKLILEWRETSTHRITLTADEIREVFGLGGTPTSELVSRLLALHAYDSSVLRRLTESPETPAHTWVSDDHWELVALNGQRLGTDGAQWVELSDEPEPTL